MEEASSSCREYHRYILLRSRQHSVAIVIFIIYHSSKEGSDGRGIYWTHRKRNTTVLGDDETFSASSGHGEISHESVYLELSLFTNVTPSHTSSHTHPTNHHPVRPPPPPPLSPPPPSSPPPPLPVPPPPPPTSRRDILGLWTSSSSSSTLPICTLIPLQCPDLSISSIIKIPIIIIITTPRWPTLRSSKEWKNHSPQYLVCRPNCSSAS